MGINVECLSPLGREKLKEGEFGLEKESLRIDPNGYLAHTPHPFPNDKHRDKDFCENQVEMITGVQYSVHAVWEELADIHRETLHVLHHLPDGTEYLWPFSNPPYVRGEEDIPVAHFEGALADKEVYRHYLAKKYGKRKMLFSGIHYNFSFPEELLREDFGNSGFSSYREYKNDIYMDLAGKVLKYSWLIVYLTAASPVFDGSYRCSLHEGTTLRSRYASPRCSEIGYWNLFLPALDFTSLETYVDSIQKYVDEGQLRQSSELYFPVRLKPLGDNSNDNLRRSGVNHIELRMLDLNPLDEIGIDERDLQFLFYLLVYLTSLPKEIISVSDQITAVRNMKNAALYDEKEIYIEQEWLKSSPVTDAAKEILDAMEARMKPILGDAVTECIAFQKNKIIDPNARYAKQIVTRYGESYVERTLKELQPWHFWGWERADAKAVDTAYSGIQTPRDLYDALRHVWCAETCAPRMRDHWSVQNRTLGQCSITAFLVQDIFGGEVRGVLRPAGNYHCFNVIGERAFDLTSEQFGDEVLNYENCPLQSRAEHFAKEEKRLRYEKLKRELRNYCEYRKIR